MKEFTVFRSHNLASPVGTLQVTDGFAKELSVYFKDHESMTIGAGYVKSGDEIEIKEVSLMFREASNERLKVAKFLRDVFESSTHGASGLMERAIKAVEDDEMSDPIKIAQPSDF